MLSRFAPKYWYLPLDPQYVCQILARLKYAYVSYSDFCKVCKKKKQKKLLGNFADSYLANVLRNLIQI